MRYFSKANKSWVTVQPERYETAKGIFKDTNLNMTQETPWSSSWYVGLQKRICDQESKRMGSRIKVTD